MSELQEIDVYIAPDGTVKVEIRGAKGKKCLALTKKLEQHLGGQIKDREYTDEFHEQPLEGEQEDWVSNES